MKYIFVIILTLSLPTKTILAQVEVSDKHLVFVNDGIGKVVGQYSFATNITGPQAEISSEIALPLPKETVDFQPLPPLEKDSIQLSKDGGLVLTRTFTKKDSVWKIQFETKPVSGTEQTLNIKIPYNIGEIRFLAPPNHFSMQSSRGKFEENVKVFGEKTWSMLTLADLKKGEEISVVFSGLRQNRASHTVLLTVTAVLLLLIVGLMFVLLVKQKPVGVKAA